MHLQFSDSYILAVLIFMIVLWFARNMLECANACLTCMQQVCVCCDPACLGYNAHRLLRGCIRQSIVCFCFLQPIFLSAIVATQRHDHDTQPALLVFCHADPEDVYAYASRNISNYTNQDTNPDFITCSHTDTIFVMMPYAVMTSINTLAWVSLTQQHSITADATWDASLFDTESDVSVALYESSYYLELWLLNFCAMANSVHGVDFLQLFFCVQALTLCLIFYVTCARFTFTHAADHFVSITVLAYLLSVITPFWYEMLDTSCETATAYAMVHAFALFILGFGHYLSAGKATVAYILTVRLLVTVVVSVTNLVVLALGDAATCQ